MDIALHNSEINPKLDYSLQLSGSQLECFDISLHVSSRHNFHLGSVLPLTENRAYSQPALVCP
eukprot:5269145-Amphidinium_carterae.1